MDSEGLSLENAIKIMEKNTWPTFSPQSSVKVYSGLSLLEKLNANSSWALASAVWRGVFFHSGTIVRDVFTQKTYVCVSHVGEMLVLAWQVAMFNVADGKMAFLVTDATIANAEPKWLNPLQLDDYDVIPTEVVSPLGLWVANARQVHDKSAVVFLQTKDPMDVMQWAADNCFWKIPESKLRIIAKELELHPPSPDLLGYLAILLHNYFPGDSPEDINNYLRLRTQVREDALEMVL